MKDARRDAVAHGPDLPPPPAAGSLAGDPRDDSPRLATAAPRSRATVRTDRGKRTRLIGRGPKLRPARGALLALAAVGLGVFSAARMFGLPPTSVALALSTYALVAALVVAGLGRHGRPRFGLANGVTLVRAGGAALFAGLAAAPALSEQAAWTAAAAAAAALALDGVDGWAARREGLASDFGARFDMETDALFILALAALALALGKAGPWVLALGAMRYAFVLAGLAWPRLARPLPASLRRKAVCVVQVAVLAAILAPPATPPASEMLAALALAALAASFAADLRWLLRAPA